MSRRAAVGAVLLASAFGPRPARAHRLDEYLQATTIAVARDRVALQLRLAPGVAAFARVFADIDTNGDGVASVDERRAYAERVLGDLALTVDGERRRLQLVAVTFPDVAALREGRGEMIVDAAAPVPDGSGGRRLTLENRHRRDVGVYLVNALVPRDSAVTLGTQRRSVDQSRYELDYTQGGAGPGAWRWVGAAVLAALGWLALLRRQPVAFSLRGRAPLAPAAAPREDRR